MLLRNYHTVFHSSSFILLLSTVKWKKRDSVLHVGTFVAFRRSKIVALRRSKKQGTQLKPTL